MHVLPSGRLQAMNVHKPRVSCLLRLHVPNVKMLDVIAYSKVKNVWNGCEWSLVYYLLGNFSHVCSGPLDHTCC